MTPAGVIASYDQEKAMEQRKVVSGGQTGADQAGLRAAREAGIETGGWAPKGWATEDGPAPWLAEYGWVEYTKKGYWARTQANVRDSDGTISFGYPDFSGSLCTLDSCDRFEKPMLRVIEGVTNPSDVVAWMAKHRITVLNVAGNRESKNRGIGVKVEAFLTRIFAKMRSKAGRS